MIRVNDVPMCGHCFRLGMTAAQSSKLHRPSVPLRDDEDLEAAVRATLEEFDELKRRMDSLLVALEIG
ncbi:MAG: hypothetical protein ACRD2J_09585 [Thermoanaerobaculia bacterium]